MTCSSVATFVYMLHRCPNCNESIPPTIVFKATHTCVSCGCLLGFRTTSEILAFGIWVVFVILIGAGRSNLFDWPWYAACPTLAMTYLLSRYLFEQFVVRVRPGLTCLECGYDLKGLPENRCPECGTPFPESAIERIRRQIDLPATQSGSGSVLMIAALLLLAALIVASLFLKYPQIQTPTATIPATQP